MVGDLKITMKCVICNALVIILRYLCNISILEFTTVPQSWIHVQIGFGIVLYNSILFFSVSCEFLPSSQYILLSKLLTKKS